MYWEAIMNISVGFLRRMKVELLLCSICSSSVHK